MKRVAVIIPLLLCWMAQSQQVFPLLNSYRLAPFTPASLPSLRFWWVSSDLVADAPVTNWIDRVAGYGLGQATEANRPTNSSAGVYFAGSPRHLTNSPGFLWTVPGTNASDPGTLFLVIKPETPAGSFGGIQTDNNDYGVFTTSGGAFREFGGVGSPTFGSFTSGAAMDLAIVVRHSSTNDFYTNGVYITTASAGQPVNNELYGGRSFNAGFYYSGHITEIIYFSTLLSGADIARLHAYATNLYGYSP